MTTESDSSVAPAQTERGARSRERLLAAAAECFTAYGYSGTRVSDIVAHAGMSQGGFYRHFPDKNTALVEAMRGPVDELLVATASGPGDTRADLAALVAQNTAFFTTYARHRKLLYVLREAASVRGSGFLELWLSTRSRFIARIEHWLSEMGSAHGIAPDDIHLAAETMGATLEQLAYVQIGMAPETPRHEQLAAMGRVSGELWFRMLHPN